MRFFAAWFVVLLVSPMAHAAQSPSLDQATLVEVVQQAVVRALEYTQGDRESLMDAEGDFSPEGWSEFMGRLNGWLDAGGAPLGSSRFLPAENAKVNASDDGVLRLTIPGTLEQRQDASRTTYQVEVDVEAGGDPVSIRHLRPTVRLHGVSKSEELDQKGP